MAHFEQGDLFPVLCTVEISAEIKDRFLRLNKQNFGPESQLVFVDSLTETYSEASQPGATTTSPATSPFTGKTEQECHLLLKKLREETGSDTTHDEFVIMDERSLVDETVLLVQAFSEEEDRVARSIRAEFQVAQSRLSGYNIVEGSVSEDEAEVSMYSHENVFRDWNKDSNGNSRWNHVPVRETGISIDRRDAMIQEKSILFRLPAELRVRIYEFVFGWGTIHVTSRMCKPASRFQPTNKLSYAVCLFASDWENTYELSKRPDTIPPMCYIAGPTNLQITTTRMWDDNIIAPYTLQHGDCTRCLGDFSSQNFQQSAEGCRLPRGSRWGFDHFENCEACQEHRKHLEFTYGPPEEGLKKFHADTALDLNLLMVCRKIYHEAFALPYGNYIFDIHDKQLEKWVTKGLFPHQARAITSLHMGIHPVPFDKPGDIKELFRLLPGLKHLKLSLNSIRVLLWNKPGQSLPFTGDKEEWRALMQINSLETVEVIVSSDGSHPNDRLERRRMAEGIERFLTMPKGTELVSRDAAIEEKLKMLGS